MSQFYDRYRLPDPKWEKEIRLCSKCGIADNPIYAHEANEDGTPKYLHRVVPDITFIQKRELTTKEKSLGYQRMSLEGGRYAIARMICRDCLDRDEETKAVWEDFDKARREAGDNHEKSYYEILCME